MVLGLLVSTCSGGSNSSSSGQQTASTSSNNSSSTTTTDIPSIGAVYWFKIHPICLNDYHAFDTLTEAVSKNDTEGEQQVVMQNGVDIGSGTHVRILNVDIYRSDVDDASA